MAKLAVLKQSMIIIKPVRLQNSQFKPNKPIGGQISRTRGTRPNPKPINKPKNLKSKNEK